MPNAHIDWPQDWNEIVAALPGAHILQTRQWGQVKQAYGWQPFPKIWRDSGGRVTAAALVLRRTITLRGINTGLGVMYVPRGPLMEPGDISLRRQVFEDLQNFARTSRSIFIKIDPEVHLGSGIPGEEDAADDPDGQETIALLESQGWRFSREQIQFRNTVWLDLAGSEEDWLARMKAKTRYNLRLAMRKGVVVRGGSLADLGLLYKMYAETSLRDGFVIRSEGYYHTVWSEFMTAGMAEPLIAEVEGEPVAALLLFTYAGRAWYLYGMSRDAHREKMPNYLLQWEAMRLARQRGCAIYDLWGAPDEFDTSDSMWGVYRFKEGLGGKVIRTIGAWDYPVRPWLYALYTKFLPRILDLMRSRGKKRVLREVSV